MCLKNILAVMEKNNLKQSDIDIYIGGDLLNQIITTNLTARDLKIPYWGVYNACSTFVEALQTASTLLDGDFIDTAIISATSHFSTAERQYRYPLELGTQSPPTAQRTVTGSGCVLLNKNITNKPIITHMTIGKVMDFEQNDPNDMGSAMAIAACDTIITHLEDIDKSPQDYDLIITGEGCSASVFCSFLYDKLLKNELNNILLVATGALLSPVSTGQKENIPCIAHAVSIENKY